MTMLHTLFRRIAAVVVVMIGVTLITFSISHLIPTDPARLIAGEQASAEIVERIREDLGLNQPVYIQYGRYMNALLHGDLGTSTRTGRPVLDDLTTYFPATVELALAALFIAVLLGIPLGVLSSLYHNRWPDHLIRTVSVVGISTPTFWLAMMMVAVFYGYLDWLPAGGRIDPLISYFPETTGFYIVDSLLAADWAGLGDVLWHLCLPAFALAFIVMGGAARLIRSSMIEVLSSDYIRTARAGGLSRWRIVMQYALPNAMIPFVTSLGLTLAALLTGTVVTEAIFAWPGLGSYMLESVFSLDFPAIMGFTVLAALIYIFTNLTVDLSYMVLDPRLRSRSSSGGSA